MPDAERKKECPESVWSHGPADVRGRCPWCGTKYTAAAPRPTGYDASDMTMAYSLYYDPDHDALTRAEIMDRYRTGRY